MDTMDMPGTLTTALAAVGLSDKDLAATPRQWQLGRFQIAGELAAASAAGAVATARRTDIRFSSFVNGWLVVAGWSCRLTIEGPALAAPLTASQLDDIISALSLVWTMSGNAAPVFRPINEALGGMPVGLVTNQTAAAALFNYAGVVPEASRTFQAVPPDVIDLQNDTLQLQYGRSATLTGGSTAPAALGIAVGVVWSAYGLLLERGALPGRPGGACDDKAVAHQVSPQRMALSA
jgi:hypothetical protein